MDGCGFDGSGEMLFLIVEIATDEVEDVPENIGKNLPTAASWRTRQVHSWTSESVSLEAGRTTAYVFDN